MPVTMNPEKEKTPVYLLGIDIGTSNVKMVLVEKHGLKAITEHSESLGPHLERCSVKNAYERSVKDIFTCIEGCIHSLNADLLKNVCSIGVCGQMHGCVLWKSSATISSLLTESPVEDQFSNFITWQDGRCGAEFLSTLPKTKQSIDTSTGYGCATLAWLQANCPEFVERFDRAATIMDLLVWLLCGGKREVMMSTQNATSWGYFDVGKQIWEKELLEDAGFPVRLLPHVVPVPSVAGKLCGKWHGVEEGTPIGVAMGDLQCSIFAAQPSANDAVLNIGSASQLAVIKPSDEDCRRSQPSQILLSPPPSLMEVPYFGGDTLLVAAALAGGNVIATFVETLQSWMRALGVQDVPEETKIYEKLISLSESKLDTTLRVNVTLWGERHQPDVRGSISNVEPKNLELGEVSSAMFRGIIENLQTMMPEEVFQELQIKRMLGSGSTLQRNDLLQKHINSVFHLPLVIKDGIDAPLGASMAAQYTVQ